MVKHWTFLFLILPAFLFSGEFTASVSRNQVNLGDSFTLNLTLKDASPQGSPSLNSLKNSFFIHSQQQSFSTSFINGRTSSSTTWKLSLALQKEGEATIPSISINTSEGTLSTSPIRIKAVKGNPTSSESGATLATEVSKTTPYKNEPVFFTVRLTSKQNLADARIHDFNIEDAIVEANGKPKVDRKFVDGIKMDVVEFSYLITPLKAGPLKIPSIYIQGAVPVRRKANMGSIFEDEYDPFFMMPMFDQLKPFTLATKETVLDVQPAIAGMNPWLPAKSIKIDEIWDESKPLQAGEPFVRGFKIAAEGIMSNQLPSLNDLQVQDNRFKIYADKPETGDEIKDGNIRSFRKEQYTLIPQEPGVLTLPEISIAWWDAARNEKMAAIVPPRTLQVLPGPENRKTHPPRIDEEKGTVPPAQDNPVQRDPILYALMAGLAVLLFAALAWVIALQKKIGHLIEIPANLKKAERKEKPPEPKYLPTEKEAKPLEKEKKEKLPDLNPT